MLLLDLLKVVYILALSGLALYGALGLYTLWLYWRHRHDSFVCPPMPRNKLPVVTVQLPIYNERFVVARLIETAVRLDYPADRLQIQVIDDSTDDTTARAAELVEHYRRGGVDIHLLHRDNRHGYKAGALAAALDEARGEFLAIFDADFQPQADFLLKTMPYFLARRELGVIQARWGHLNAGASPLTAAQAIALDKHFIMDQTVRHRANLFPRFNGAAGVWRRQCLEDAGGWQDDTVCEDLCLSTRAVLRGWEFLFLQDLVTPAELPASIAAYKSQQARWAQGSVQCLRKFAIDILRDRDHSLAARLYALLTMSAYLTHFLLLLVLLLQIPLIYVDVELSPFFLVFTVIGIGQPLLFVLAQQVAYRDWPRRLLHFPTMLLLAVGMAPSNGRAILQGLFVDRPVFVRTPKGDVAPRLGGYRLKLDYTLMLELFLAAYAAVALLLAIARHELDAMPLLITCLLGFSYVAFLELREWRQAS